MVSSGIGGSCFKGLVIGMVAKVEVDASGYATKVTLTQGTSSELLQEVLVVLAMNSDGAAKGSFKNPHSYTSSDSSSDSSSNTEDTQDSEDKNAAETSEDNGDAA